MNTNTIAKSNPNSRPGSYTAPISTSRLEVNIYSTNSKKSQLSRSTILDQLLKKQIQHGGHLSSLASIQPPQPTPPPPQQTTSMPKILTNALVHSKSTSSIPSASYPISLQPQVPTVVKYVFDDQQSNELVVEFQSASIEKEKRNSNNSQQSSSNPSLNGVSVLVVSGEDLMDERPLFEPILRKLAERNQKTLIVHSVERKALTEKLYDYIERQSTQNPLFQLSALEINNTIPTTSNSTTTTTTTNSTSSSSSSFSNLSSGHSTPLTPSTPNSPNSPQTPTPVSDEQQKAHEISLSLFSFLNAHVLKHQQTVSPILSSLSTLSITDLKYGKNRERSFALATSSLEKWKKEFGIELHSKIKKFMTNHFQLQNFKVLLAEEWISLVHSKLWKMCFDLTNICLYLLNRCASDSMRGIQLVRFLKTAIEKQIRSSIALLFAYSTKLLDSVSKPEAFLDGCLEFTKLASERVELVKKSVSDAVRSLLYSTSMRFRPTNAPTTTTNTTTTTTTTSSTTGKILNSSTFEGNSSIIANIAGGSGGSGSGKQDGSRQAASSEITSTLFSSNAGDQMLSRAMPIPSSLLTNSSAMMTTTTTQFPSFESKLQRLISIWWCCLLRTSLDISTTTIPTQTEFQNQLKSQSSSNPMEHPQLETNELSAEDSTSQFRSFSFLLHSKSEEQHQSIRTSICVEILSNPTLYGSLLRHQLESHSILNNSNSTNSISRFKSKSIDVDEYVSELSLQESYGDFISLIALANRFRTNIVVHSPLLIDLPNQSILIPNESNSTTTIHLLFLPSNHWQPLHPIIQTPPTTLTTTLTTTTNNTSISSLNPLITRSLSSMMTSSNDMDITPQLTQLSISPRLATKSDQQQALANIPFLRLSTMGEDKMEFDQQPQPRKRGLLSLNEICLRFLCENVESIPPLDHLPEHLRNSLLRMLIDGCQLTSPLFLSIFGSDPFLTTLDLSHFKKLERGVLSSIAQRCGSFLIRINLDRCLSINNSELCVLLSSCAKSIRILSVDGCFAMDDRATFALTENVSSSQITSLELSNCINLTSTAVSSLLSKVSTTLQKLCLNGCSQLLGSVFIDLCKRISMSTEESRLVELDTRECALMGDEALDLLSGTTFPHASMMNNISVSQNLRIIRCGSRLLSFHSMERFFRNSPKLETIDFDMTNSNSTTLPQQTGSIDIQQQQQQQQDSLVFGSSQSAMNAFSGVVSVISQTCSRLSNFSFKTGITSTTTTPSTQSTTQSTTNITTSTNSNANTPSQSTTPFLRTSFSSLVPSIKSLELRSLTSFCVTKGIDLKDEAIIELGKYNNQLIDIDLSACESISEVGMLELTRSCGRSLKSLKLGGPKISNAVVNSIGLNCIRLDCLWIVGGCSIDSSSMLFLNQLVLNLVELDLGGCEVIGDNGIRNLLSIMIANSIAQQKPQQRSLKTRPMIEEDDMSLESNHRNAQSAPINKKKGIVFTERMKVLRVGQCGLTNASAILIADCFPRLECLDVSFCNELSDSSLDRIVKSCPRIRQLDLSYVGRELSLDSVNRSISFLNELNTLSLRGFLQYSDQKLSHPNLQVLNLSWCKNLKDSAITNMSCPLLETLQLAWCSCLSTLSVQYLSNSFHNLRLLNVRGCTGIPNSLIKYLQQTGKILSSSSATPNCSPSGRWLLTWLPK